MKIQQYEIRITRNWSDGGYKVETWHRFNGNAWKRIDTEPCNAKIIAHRDAMQQVRKYRAMGANVRMIDKTDWR